MNIEQLRVFDHSDSIRNSRHGFTLVELMVYVLIVGLTLLAIGSMTSDVSTSSLRSQAKRSVSDAANFMLHRLQTLTSGAASFTVVSPTEVILVAPDSEVTRLELTLQGTFTVKPGTSPADPIHDPAIAVTGTFSDWSAAGRSRNLGVHLDVATRGDAGFSDGLASLALDTAFELGAQ